MRSSPELELVVPGRSDRDHDLEHPGTRSARTQHGQTIPYGRPNANNRAYILDPDGLDCPDWVAGEIYAAGTGLARGYWADQDRTDARFSEDPTRGERLFNTGDLGRYLPDGSIAILGRSDFQIKINGYRIEAGEVETRLVDIAGDQAGSGGSPVRRAG